MKRINPIQINKANIQNTLYIPTTIDYNNVVNRSIKYSHSTKSTAFHTSKTEIRNVVKYLITKINVSTQTFILSLNFNKFNETHKTGNSNRHKLTKKL